MSQSHITRRKIKKLFVDLERELGFLAKFNWTCCQSCGWGDLYKYCQNDGVHSDEKNIIFCHMQDCDYSFGLNRHGEPKSKMINDLSLTWSGDGHKIKEAIESRGFQVEWDGKAGTRLQIKSSNVSL
jgi:hypothetical protein